MNISVKESLDKLKYEHIPGKPIPGQILPHQLASLDFIYKNISKGKNVLLFHKMGSGKTIVCLFASYFLSMNPLNKKIFIMLPNKQIKSSWINQKSKIDLLLPFSIDYNINDIKFITKRDFIEDFEVLKKKRQIIKDKYKNAVFIIDEAHNMFGNTGKDVLIELNSFYEKNDFMKPMYILVTGSPITNTLLTVKDLINILTYNNVAEAEYMQQDGNKIYNYNLNQQGIEIISKYLEGTISYYSQNKSNIPPVKYIGNPLIRLPVVNCFMSDVQTKDYYHVKELNNNDMFLKSLLDASFTAMGEFKNTSITNFEDLLKDKKQHILTDQLFINNGVFQGPELLNLNNSCKLKYFVNNEIYTKEERKKTMIYFANSRIGGRFIKDSMNAHGIQEYGAKKLMNFTCYYCKKKRTCKKCKPITYMMITSIPAYFTYLASKSNSNMDNNNSLDSINSLLEIFNSESNDQGEDVLFLFVSKIFSESYTVKEVYKIYFLTNPNSLSELSQITARALRNFSYKDLTKPVYVYILVAIPKDFDLNLLNSINSEQKSIILSQENKEYKENINDYIEKLMQENNFPYDIKKILYLEIKSEQTNSVHNLFKKLSNKYNERIHPNLDLIYVLEVLRRFSYNQSSFLLEDFLKLFSNLSLERERIIFCLTELIKDGVIVFNKKFKQSFLLMKDDLFYVKPVIIENNNHLCKIRL